MPLELLCAVLCLLLAVCILALASVATAQAALSEATVKEVEQCLNVHVMKFPMTVRPDSSVCVFIEVYQNSAREGKPLLGDQPASRIIRKPVMITKFSTGIELLEDPFVLVIVDNLPISLGRRWKRDEEQLTFSASAGIGSSRHEVFGHTVSLDLTEFIGDRDVENAHIEGGPLPTADLSTCAPTPVYVVDLCWDESPVDPPNRQDLEGLAKFRDLVVAVTVQVTY